MRFRYSLLVLAALVPDIARAQSSTAGTDALRVYLDCSHFCDTNFIRTEINYLNWVRDKADAQVHVIVSRLATAGGGSEYTFTFTGRENFTGREDTLRYTARTTDSDDIVRRGIARTLKIGLVPFLARTAGAERLQVTYGAQSAPSKAETAGQAKRDPWNYWVFSFSLRGNVNGQQSQNFGYYGGNVSANRTTDELKLRIGVNSSYGESNFTYDPGTGVETTVTSIRRNYSLHLLGVKSLTSHWSAGIQSGANSATFGNIQLGLNGGPAVEYSLWPYAEATRRSLVLRYGAGISSFDYRERTIYDVTQETHPVHSLAAELNLRQRFGSISFETNFSQYLHNTSFYNASLFANANLKLFKGFSMDFFGNYQKVRDQLSLPATDLTPEQVLLQQRQRRTGFNYWGGFGVRYSFGSIFNNVVNPRFGDGGGGGGFIIMN